MRKTSSKTLDSRGLGKGTSYVWSVVTNMQVTITNGDKPKKARRSTSQRLHAKTVGNPQLETNCTATSNPGSVEATAWTLSLTHVLNGFSGSGLKKLIRSQTFTKACATNTKTRPLEELSFFLRFCLILSSQMLAKTEAGSGSMRVFFSSGRLGSTHSHTHNNNDRRSIRPRRKPAGQG